MNFGTLFKTWNPKQVMYKSYGMDKWLSSREQSMNKSNKKMWANHGQVIKKEWQSVGEVVTSYK